MQTESILCGADIIFNDGLVVLRAKNTSGKSTLVQSIIYVLGLEGMLSASHDVPLPHVMTDLIEVDGTELRVTESYVSLEIENAVGEVATVLRGIKGQRNKNLVTVHGVDLDESTSTHPVGTDYYVREGGAATNERGFHKWFASFVGWSPPQVDRIDGTDCPLYVECIFPLMIIEQKKGWSAIQARMPYHYRIRDVAKKATEFLLDLDVYELARRRQKLREEVALLKNEWALVVDRIAAHSRSINGIVQNLNDHAPRYWESDEEPSILVSRSDGWIPFNNSLRRDIDELANLELREIPRAETVAQSVETDLSIREAELGNVDFAASELLHEIDNDQRQLTGISVRLTALEEDQRRNRDLLKLQHLGSIQSTDTSHGICPTCHQAVNDALLPQNESQRLMTVEENLNFIHSQIETFATIRQASLKSLTAKRRRMDALKARASDLRATIRAIRQTLVGENNQFSIEAIERRIQLREKIVTARRAEDQIASECNLLRNVGQRWKAVQESIAALPKGDLSEADKQKLRRLRELFVSAVSQFGMRSVNPSTLRISEENYKPEHEGFNIEFDLSASDMIRTLWAYLNGLLELSREFETNHLGLLILDEPKQQETARVSFGELFRRTSSVSNHKQQIIIATSEDESTLLPLLDGVQHQYIHFAGFILLPIYENAIDAESDEPDEMPWEIEAREAVESALSSMYFNAETRGIEFRDYQGESVSVDNRQDLIESLEAIAAEAWMSQVPVDDGEPVFDCDEASIVSDAITEYENQIDEFFSGEDFEMEY